MIRSLDMFGVSQFILYRSQEQYNTKTGGVVSILIIGILVALFLTKTIDAFNYTKINVVSETIYDLQPKPLELKFNPKNKFMIAIGISGGLDYTYHQKLGLYLANITINNSIDELSVVPLAPCQFDQWSGISEQIDQQFKSFEINKLLCPPTDFSLPIEGKESSKINRYLGIYLMGCPVANSCPMGYRGSSILNNTNPKIHVYYINTIINPSNKNPFTYYIQDVASFYFNYEKTLSVQMKLSEYQMTTDWSLMPWQQGEKSSGIITIGSSSFIKQSFLFTNSTLYANIVISKSNERFIYTRNFQKITDVISFVGGLLGPLLLVASIVKLYNKSSFQIQFGDRIFTSNQKSKISSQKFNFFYFIKMSIFLLLNKLNIQRNWQQTKTYVLCKSEVIKQLDIYLLFKKIELLEEACNTLLEQHHLIGLHLLAKRTLKQAQKKRKRHLMQDLFNTKAQRLSNIVNINEEQILRERQRVLKQKYQQFYQGEGFSQKKTKDLLREFTSNYQRLQLQSQMGCLYSKKIMNRLMPNRTNPQLIALSQSDEENNHPLNQNIATHVQLVHAHYICLFLRLKSCNIHTYNQEICCKRGKKYCFQRI